MKSKKIIFFVLLSLMLIGAFVAYRGYNIIYGPNVSGNKSHEFFIHSEDEISDVLANLKTSGLLKHDGYLDLIADKMSFTTSSPKSGRYIIEANMSTYDILNKLRLGIQTPVLLTIRGLRKIEHLAGYLGEHLQYDSLHYLTALKTDPDNSLCNYLPDSYEFYWSTNGESFKKRMESYRQKFWDGKPQQVLNHKLTPCEMYILASIVEKESANEAERPDIAGLYINRLKRGIPLQADPTVIFSLDNFSIRRVLTKYLSVDSPYNTYLNQGLPPGPICMPSKSSILSVINARKHDYIYMCAKPDNSGTHAFAETLTQHNRNARAFQRWLNERGIKQ